VMNELAHEREVRTSQQRDARLTESIALIEEARAAFKDESDDVIEHNAQLFDDNNTGASRNTTPRDSHSPDGNERTEQVVTHRFSKRDDDPNTAPRRIITLRDARRGRPRRANGKHGADPPT
jgi:hypothetical protein